MRFACLLLPTLVGCSYPSFSFVAGESDATVRDDGTFDATTPDVAETLALDTTVPDTQVPDTTEPPVTIDTSSDVSADTSVADTKVDTSIVVDAGAPVGCMGSTALFCADFDAVTSPGTGWTYTSVSPTATITIDSSGGRSAPNAFLASTAPGAVDAAVVANLSKQFVAAATTTPMRADLWLKLETATFPGKSAFLLKVQRAMGAGDGITLSIDSMGNFFVDRIGVSYEAYPIAGKPKVGTWIHVRADVTLHTTAGAITLWIDDMGTPVLSKTGVSTVEADTTARQMIVGLYTRDGTGPFRARYDDVSFSFR